MVKEYVKVYSLYSASYYDQQERLLAQYQEKKRQIEEYLREVKDIILDDIRDTITDKRQSLDARTIVNAPKTPGMTMRRTKRKLRERKGDIIVESPDTSIISTAPSAASTATKVNLAGCLLNDTTDTPTNASTRLTKQTKINSILNTPTSVIGSGRLTRARARQLTEQSSIVTTPNSTVHMTPKMILFANETASNDRTIGETPQKCRAVDSSYKLARTTETPNRTRILQSETVCETPIAGDGVTPVAGDGVTPVGAERTLQMGNETPISRVMNSTAISGDNQGKVANLVVSSPIGPIVTSGTPNTAWHTKTPQADWVVSTGKRKSSKVTGTNVEIDGPASTPVVNKHIQLSLHQPSPIPVPTPANQPPTLLSVTIAGPVTPETGDVPAPGLGTVSTLKPNTPHVSTPAKQQTPHVSTPAKQQTPHVSIPAKQQTPHVSTPTKPPEAPALEGVLEEETAGTPDSSVRCSNGKESLVHTPVMAGISTPARVVTTPALKKVREPSAWMKKSKETDLVEEEETEMVSAGSEEDEISVNCGNEDKQAVVCQDEEMEAVEERFVAASENSDDVKDVSMVSEEHLETVKREQEEEEVKEEIASINDIITPQMSKKKSVVSTEQGSIERVAEGLVFVSDVVPEPEVEDGREEANESDQLFESCEEGGDAITEAVKETTEIQTQVEPAPLAEDVRIVRVTRASNKKSEGNTDKAEDTTIPQPKRQTRSSRNKKLKEKQDRLSAEKENQEMNVKEPTTVKKIAADFEAISKTKELGQSGIPLFSSKSASKPKQNEPIDERLEISKRERETSSTETDEDKSKNSCDESIHMKKKLKNNEGAPKNPNNLVTSMISFINKPAVVVKSAKELEEERKEAAKRKIEEKEAKAKQVLNKKKQRENELRLKRIEKEKRMRQAKQNKEDEAKKKKADLEERMRKKEEASAKEREALAKKEEEKRQREVKRQEQVEQRRKQAEKARELKHKRMQEEQEERKAEALKRKQELEAIRVRELEKHRMEEEARMEEQRRLESEEKEKRRKAEEDRKKLEEVVADKKKTTPSRINKKMNITANAGTLLTSTPPPKPPPRTKHTKPTMDTTKPETIQESLVSALVETETKSSIAPKAVEQSVERPVPFTSSSSLHTPLAQSKDTADSPASAASGRMQSYMKNKLLSLGQSKTRRNLGSRLDVISEDHKQSSPKYDPRDNYKIDDIESGDDTDDESKPKRTVPSWARNRLALDNTLHKQFTAGARYTAKDIFGPYPKTADLDKLFGTVNRYTSRTSSAHWSSAPAAGNLDFSILTEEEINHANNILLRYK